MGDSNKPDVDAPRQTNHKSVLGRPRGKGPGITKHCQFGVCKTDSRCLWKTKNSSIYFISFPKPCLEFRKGITHEIAKCQQCYKARKWLDLCERGDGRFNDLWHIKPYHYICSLHFVGGKGPTDLFPDPISAHATHIKKNKLNKILENECSNNQEAESSDDSLKENPFESIVNNKFQSSNYEGTRKLYMTSLMFMESSGFSVDLTSQYLSIKVCSGMFVEKEFRFFELESHLEIYIFNKLLPLNHKMYADLKKINIATSGVQSFKSVLTDWYNCSGNRDKKLIGMFNETENRAKGIYIPAREAIFSLKCSILIRLSNKQCEECQKLNASLTKSLERKNQNNSRTNYNKMTYSELIMSLKAKSAQNSYYRQKLNKLGMLKSISKDQLSESMEKEIVQDTETKDGDFSVCTITFQDIEQVANLSENDLYVYNNTIMRSVLKPQIANVSNEPLMTIQMQGDDLG